MKTTNLWRQLFSDKKSPQRKSASATIANLVEIKIGTTMNSSNFLTSHTLSWKMKKFVPQKIASRMNTKKDIFQKHKNQNQKLSSPMNCQQTHNVLTDQKSSAVSFEDVKTEETFSSQDQKLVETTNLWRQLRTKNHHSANLLLQRSLI